MPPQSGEIPASCFIAVKQSASEPPPESGRSATARPVASGHILGHPDVLRAHPAVCRAPRLATRRSARRPTVSQESNRMRKLILVPAVITLAVTLLRLVGELQGWSEGLFNRSAGGGGRAGERRVGRERRSRGR